MECNTISVKLVAVGDGGAGKTCLLVAYSNRNYSLLNDYLPTVYLGLSAPDVCDGKSVSFMLCDTAGQVFSINCYILSTATCDRYTVNLSRLTLLSVRPD